MPRFMSTLAATALGLALVAGAACSDSNGGPTAPGDQAKVESTATQKAGSTQQTTVNKSSNELSTADLVKLAEDAVVRIETNGGVGTGFVVDSGGYILTNNHVVLGATGRISNTIRVTLSDGDVVAATVVGTDSRADLALIKIDRTGLKALQFADLDTVLIGQDVVAIGYALDLKQGEGPSYSVTRGIVSQKNRAIDEGGPAILGAVQTDAAINHGNSGGPLLNLFGEVVGVNTALAPDPTTGGTADGIGFAVGSNTARAVFEQLKANGKVTRGYLGISNFSALRPAQAKQMNIPDGQGGLVVGQVVASDPAGVAGLKAGDVIIKVGSYQISSEADLAVALIKQSAGQKVSVEFYRDGKKSSVDVTLGTAPA